MMPQNYTVRNANREEFESISKLMADVYANLDGFPKPSEQPAYYHLLANVGDFTHDPQTDVIVALSPDNAISGAVVFFTDMKHYGSGGKATQERNAAGFRLLAVDRSARGKGIGKLLVAECIARAKAQKISQLIIHSTKAMQTAWVMYESIGFERSEDLDFMQGELPVFGFRLKL